MNKKSKKDLLLEIGMKEALLDKLNDDVMENIAIYAVDHHRHNNLLNTLIQIASLETKGKHGSAYLTANGLATVTQLKNIETQKLAEIVEDHKHHDDEALTTKKLKQALVYSQQEKLYTKTDGYKGEYFIDPRDEDD